MTRRELILPLCALVAGILLGAGFRSCTEPRADEPEPLVIHDTIVRTDSVIIEHTQWRYRTFHDTTIVRVPDTTAYEHDTTLMGDSLTLRLPIDHYEYVDSFGTDTACVRLRVLYSGYRASIDTVGLSYRFVSEPVVVEKERGFGQFVGLGVSAGYGLCTTDGRQFYASPTIALTVTYGWGYTWRKRKSNRKAALRTQYR